MITRLRATMTISYEYTANSHDYGTDDVKEMCKIDHENFVDDPSFIFECFDTRQEDDLSSISVDVIEVS